MPKLTRTAWLVAALSLAAALEQPAAAQGAPKQCGCQSHGPSPFPSPDPGGNPAAGEGSAGGGDGHWLALLPFAAVAAILGRESGPALVPVVDTGLANVVSPREARAAQQFYANADSLGVGLRAPDTATLLPNVVALAAVLGALGGALRRRRHA